MAKNTGNTPTYRYNMGFAVNGTAIPDPATFSGAVSDLDTMGKRDATGYTHRKRVATKNPLKLSYTALAWPKIKEICKLLENEKFSFTFPDPAIDGTHTIDAYVGDREWEVVKYLDGDAYIGTLKFSVIEY